MVDNSYYIASAVIRLYQQNAPVDVQAIAEHLGIKIKIEPLPPNVSGMLKFDRGGPSGYSIYVNSSHHRRRQRFTIAHEIAHFALHRDLLDSGIVDDAMYRSSNTTNEMETQANRFAANILMPQHLIKKMREQGRVSIADIASHLDVSEEALRISLNMTGDGGYQMPVETD